MIARGQPKKMMLGLVDVLVRFDPDYSLLCKVCIVVSSTTHRFYNKILVLLGFGSFDTVNVAAITSCCVRENEQQKTVNQMGFISCCCHPKC